MALGGFVLGSLIIYLKGMRRMMFQLSGFYYKPIIKRPIKVGISHVHPLITKPNMVGISLSTAAYAHVIFGSLIKKVTTLGTTRIPTRATTRGCDYSYCTAYELHGPLKIHVEVTTREINLRALHWASTHYSKGCIGFAKKCLVQTVCVGPSVRCV